ncbi:MAG TPA: hypothetical protein DCX89_03660 [Saprospirales bacterium]|nr:hypothetical protein [Saprospirales bacterium]HAY70962.1 hypothetical protein [Saprospirales bacterium]HRQ28492.1 hypothetical protein [Saprospiraceae bacterium]
MEEIYTENALVRYLYKESDLFERLEIEDALENDQQLFRLFVRLNKAKINLSHLALLPSVTSIQNILNCSAALSVEA